MSNDTCGKFLYVFSKDAKKKLLDKGLKLIQENDKNEVYVFLNNQKATFDLSEVFFLPSDTIAL